MAAMGQRVEMNFELMSSFVAVYTASIGLLVDRAKNMKVFDVADQNTCDMIASEISNIRKMLDKDKDRGLLVSLDHFERGIVNLNLAFEKIFKNIREDTSNCTQAASLGIWDQPLTEYARDSLEDAKDGFEDARKEAKEAFSDEALKTTDRILALKIRLVAIILTQHLDRSEFDLDDNIGLCLKDLHDMPEVCESFQVLFSRDEIEPLEAEKHGDIFVGVYEVHHTVSRVKQVIDGNGAIPLPPHVLKSGDTVDVLKDGRNVITKLQELQDAQDAQDTATNNQIAAPVTSAVTRRPKRWDMLLNAGNSALQSVGDRVQIAGSKARTGTRKAFDKLKNWKKPN